MPVLSNPKHERFAQGLAKGNSQAQAYIDAGYTGDETAACRLSRNVKVTARVAELLERGAAKVEFDVARVLEEFRRIALADIRNIFGEDGQLLNPHDMSDEMAAAVSSIEVIERRVVGDEKRVEHVHKIKLNDKLGALNSAARIFGMFIDRIDANVHGALTINIAGDAADL